VTVLEKGFAWNGKSYSSLSQIAKAKTGTAWNGHRFFGLRTATTVCAQARRGAANDATAGLDIVSVGPTSSKQFGHRRSFPSDADALAARGAPGSGQGGRCNTRAHHEAHESPSELALRHLYPRLYRARPRLEQEFNSLDNQREASEAYIKSQAHEGWRLMRDRYDDGGFSGGSMERSALKKLLDAIRARRIDVIVVYKVDR
jgi:Protein of unknown function (DUF2924)/Resolvase, N terminal domain